MNPWLESERMRQVQTPIIPVIAGLVREHPGTLSLGQGVVWYGPPPSALEQLEHFLARPEQHKYQPVQGIPPLLERLEKKLQTENGIAVRERRALLVTAGGNLAFMNAILAVTSPGDEVLLFTPYYFNHEMAVRMAGCTPVLVETDDRFLPCLERMENALTPRTRAVVTISPNNPAGAVYPEELLRTINDLCRIRGLYHVHDEAYEYFVYGNARHYSPGCLPQSADHTFSLFSLSKAYGFASWRIGYMVFPERLEPALRKIQDTLLICPPVISQYAAAGALDAGRDYCQPRIRQIAQVRELVLAKLNKLAGRVRITESTGAFYFLLSLETASGAFDVAERLIREHGVAVIPGSAFGLTQGCTVRLAYGALELDTAQEALNRLVRGLESILNQTGG